MTIEIITPPTNAIIVNIGWAGDVLIQAGAFTGADSFTYRLYSPDCGYSNVATVNLNIISAVPSDWPNSIFHARQLTCSSTGQTLTMCGECLLCPEEE